MRINDSFLLVLAFMIFVNGTKLLVFLLICSLIHEIGHIIFMIAFRVKIRKVELCQAGFRIHTTNITNLSNFKQIIIYSGGIFFGIVFSILCYNIANSGFYSYNFFLLCGISIYLSVFNILPIRILDGGQILFAVLTLFFDFNTSYNILEKISRFMLALLGIIGLIFVFQGNMSILLLSLNILYIQK